VKVIIGTGILDALTLLSDDNTIDNLASSMEDFAVATSEVIVGLGKVAEKLKALNVPGVGNIFDVRNIPVIGAYINPLRQYGRSDMPQQDRGGQERTAFRINTQQRKKEAEIIKNAARARKAELDALNKKNVIENKNLEELKKKFDLERIGLTQALNVATDGETKLRLRAQLAILDENEALAKKLLAEMEAADALKKLAEAALLAANVLSSFNPAMFRMGEERSMQNIPSVFDKAPAGTLDPLPSFAGGFDVGRFRMGEERSMVITIDTAQTGDKFSQLIAESIQVANRSGYSTVPNGFIV
jgi:hypothetical protein